MFFKNIYKSFNMNVQCCFRTYRGFSLLSAKQHSAAFMFYSPQPNRTSLTVLNQVLRIPLVQQKCRYSFTPRYFSSKQEFQPNIKKLLDDSATFENENDDDSKWSTSPYPKGSVNPREQSRHSLRPKVDPRDTSLVLFPGEGSQYVGMGKNLLKFPEVKDIFAAASDILKYDVLSLCLQGPKSKLDDTRFSQVAVMVCSFAALEKLKEERPDSFHSCIATAGFGIGELTALTFAGSISFDRAVRLAQMRGEAMHVASSMEPSGLMTVIYKADTKLHEVLERAKEHAAGLGVEKPVCEVANYLFPHCKVLGGHNQCLDFIEKNHKSLNLRQVRRLSTKGAHNTSLMKPAAETFRSYLKKSNLKDPVISVHSCIDGKIYHDKEEIVPKLSKQIWRPIRWEQMMHIMYERPLGDHFPNTYECGPGNTLKTLLKMTNAKAYDHCETVFG